MNFEDLLPEVLPSVNGCPSFTAADHIRRAAREFCRKTHVWQSDLAPFNTAIDTTTYALAVPAGSSVVRLFRVDIGDQYGVDLLDEASAKAQVASGSQSTFAWLSGASLRINPAPMSVMAMQVQVSLKPSATAEAWPDDLGENHREALIYGALATLFEMPKTDWSDDGKADRNNARFNAKVNAAARNRTKGRATQGRRTTTFF